jgi:aquaporin Z
LACVPRALSGVERTGIEVSLLVSFHLLLIHVLRSVGVSFPNLGESSVRGFLLEVILSFFFVLVVLSVRLNERRHSSFILAFAYTTVRLISFPLTGGSLNPARVLAHSIVGTYFYYFWISFIAPLIGALLGTVSFLLLHEVELKRDPAI